jgi:hypothetical protein
MGITLQALEEYFSPNIGSIVHNKIIPLSDEINPNYVQQFTLVTMLKLKVDKKIKAIFFWILRKVQNSVLAYKDAFIAIDGFTNNFNDKISLYLRALTDIETVLSNCYQVFEVCRKLTSIDIYNKGDNSKYERLNKCYIRIKHLESLTLDDNIIHATWIDNDGFKSCDSILTYQEINEILEENIHMANNLSVLNAQ